MFDIITFGSATHDIFLRLNKNSYQIVKSKTRFQRESICFNYGSKIFIEKFDSASGGGGTNTAVSFTKQGFRTAFCGKVGKEKLGKYIIQEINEAGVDTKFVKVDKKYKTANSIVLSSAESGERTIFLYRGACHFMKKSEIPFNEIRKTKWFYIAPLSVKSAAIFAPLVNFAKKNKIRLAVNPGNTQLKLGVKKLKPILSKVDILFLNQEEASFLTKISLKKEEEIIEKLLSLVKNGIVVITKGKDGSVVSDGKNIFRAKSIPVSVYEKTGAGDAFASGFLGGLLRKNNIEYAIAFGTANATSCIKKIGAKNGLLKSAKKSSLQKLKVKRKSLSGKQIFEK